MPPHLIQRGPKKIYYLVDGRTVKSLATSTKRSALLLLEQYHKGKLHIHEDLTVQEYYDTWIEGRENDTTLRPSRVRDYKAAFRNILPVFGDTKLSQVDVPSLEKFRVALLRRGLSIKSVQNIINDSFRAMWRSALKDETVTHNPFKLIEWQRPQYSRPDPFTKEERDNIVEWWFTNDLFYYPWVFTLFHTGMRPSEAAALSWNDVDLEGHTLSITKSLSMKKVSAPKTARSHRTIRVSESVIFALSILPSKAAGLDFVFVNKHGGPLTATWGSNHWNEPLKKLGIRQRKFYSTRHTFITEAVKADEKLLAIAVYCGTSVKMIQDNYCGAIGMVSLDTTNLQHVRHKAQLNQPSYTGCPQIGSSRAIPQLRRKPQKTTGGEEQISEKNVLLHNIDTTNIRQGGGE